MSYRATQPQRPFSFDYYNGDNIPYQSPAQIPYPPTLQHHGTPSGYQMSTEGSYLPPPPREHTVSPPSPPQFRPNPPPLSSFHHFQAQRLRDLQSQRNQYGRSPSPEIGGLQLSAPPYENDSPPRRKPLPVPPLPPSYQTTPPRISSYRQGRLAESASRQEGGVTVENNSNNAAAGGGMADWAMEPTGTYLGQAGGLSLRELESLGRGGELEYERNFYDEPEQDFPSSGTDHATLPQDHRPRGHMPEQQPYSSATRLTAAAAAPGVHAVNYTIDSNVPIDRYPSPSQYHGGYGENGYNQYPPAQGSPIERVRAGFGAIDPRDIADEEEGDLSILQPAKRKDRHAMPAAAASAGAGAGAGGFLKSITSRDPSGQYGQVSNGEGNHAEKSDWLSRQTSGNKRLKWMVGGLIALVIILAIVGGTIGSVFANKNSSSSTSSSTDNGPDLTKESPAIKALMNNPNLHKVFTGIDYTPLNAQYPDCLTSPPAQNNITKDIAVLSQLTPQVRLYGTDCNQTEMVLHAIDLLGLENDMKVWLGVWQESNATTNARQLVQMYSVLDSAGVGPFAGVIVGNEVLFRKDMTVTQLVGVLDGVRSNLTAKNFSLPIATSDLGSAWTAPLAAAVDVVMANIHPFFGGVAVDQAASWTWDFWQNNDVTVTAGMAGKKQVISEVGWPSSGGNDCGTDTAGNAIACATASQGSVAGIAQMNMFLGDWVCQSLANGTEYFW